MIYAGIDPGIGGAVAAIHNESVYFWDAPWAVSGGRKVLVPTLMANILKKMLEIDQCCVAIERVHSMPRDSGVGSFTFGKGVGFWIGIMTVLNIPYDEVTPQRWTKAMLDGMPKDKDSSRLRALQLYPQLQDQLNLKKHHGRSDALLLATYRMRLR